jgi:hypothetical protein
LCNSVRCEGFVEFHGIPHLDKKGPLAKAWYREMRHTGLEVGWNAKKNRAL